MFMRRKRIKKRDFRQMQGEFDHFTPEQFLPDVEKLLGAGLTGYACAFTSYVNRVYELETTSGDREEFNVLDVKEVEMALRKAGVPYTTTSVRQDSYFMTVILPIALSA